MLGVPRQTRLSHKGGLGTVCTLPTVDNDVIMETIYGNQSVAQIDVSRRNRGTHRPRKIYRYTIEEALFPLLTTDEPKTPKTDKIRLPARRCFSRSAVTFTQKAAAG